MFLNRLLEFWTSYNLNMQTECMTLNIYIKNQEIEKTQSSLCFVFLVFLNHKHANGNIFFFFFLNKKL